jgi:hypothetical protein
VSAESRDVALSLLQGGNVNQATSRGRVFEATNWNFWACTKQLLFNTMARVTLVACQEF